MASAPRLGDGDDAVYRRAPQYLRRAARRPVDDDAVHPLPSPEPEVQPPVVLARESRPAVDDPPLCEISRLEHHLGADRAAIAARADEPEGDPVVGAVGIAAIQHRWLILVRDDHVDGAAIGEVGERHRAAVVQVRHADRLRHIHPPRDPAIEVDA
jgi:hypothetical protein